MQFYYSDFFKYSFVPNMLHVSLTPLPINSSLFSNSKISQFCTQSIKQSTFGESTPTVRYYKVSLGAYISDSIIVYIQTIGLMYLIRSLSLDLDISNIFLDTSIWKIRQNDYFQLFEVNFN